MISNSFEARSESRPATLRFIAVLAAGLVLAACGNDQPAEQTAAPAATTAPPAPTPAPAVS